MSENERQAPQADRGRIVNDFCLTFATINGSGSATANSIILRSLFRMGIPVSGKNIFPSNIQGLPTWYTIRLSRKGYLARVDHDDIVVAMNPATMADEIKFITKGGVLFYADDLPLPELRQDITAYPMPVKKIIKDNEVAPNLRGYIANMVYVGVVAQMLGIPLELIRETVNHQFKGKQKAVESNFSVIEAAAAWAKENLVKSDPYFVEKMGDNKDYIMVDGNEACALGSVFGGAQFVAWYPITPASSLVETFNEYLPKLRKDPETGKDTCAVVQAEDELAAIGMSIGAGWAGLRAMTSTSGPGLSLMSEYLGLAYYAEVPVVIFDVQRVGPSTGLPTRTAQGDMTQVNFISHGDTQFIMLMPSSVNECFEHSWKAFDLAEQLQTPVMVMTDLDLGMNQWMTPRFQYPDQPINRGKVLWDEDIKKLEERIQGTWGRYLDVDGDGIPYRTVMGNLNPRSAYFTRGTGHDEYGRYSEEPDVWERVLARVASKFETARGLVPAPELVEKPGAKVGIIAYGSTEPAVREAMDLLDSQGLPTAFLRLRATPFTKEVEEFIKKYERIYVVEINRDGQMRQLLLIDYPQYATRFIQAAHMDGLPLTADWIVKTIKAGEEQ